MPITTNHYARKYVYAVAHVTGARPEDLTRDTSPSGIFVPERSAVFVLMRWDRYTVAECGSAIGSRGKAMAWSVRRFRTKNGPRWRTIEDIARRARAVLDGARIEVVPMRQPEPRHSRSEQGSDEMELETVGHEWLHPEAKELFDTVAALRDAVWAQCRIELGEDPPETAKPTEIARRPIVRDENRRAEITASYRRIAAGYETKMAGLVAKYTVPLFKPRLITEGSPR